ncbi:hypothetical protein [Synechococcus sp. MVIR-18-1]|uniref:hypothetical protein n=1 Tax=Synechococcus sp. MVIR-18-1 TaxID=1386941 RepID=UPI00164883B4|nr:hypothetical protein [Synechococcus sp. MVIR-18-1]
MTGKSEKPIHIKQNISSLDQQIKAKEKLVQKVIDQKQDLRQSYIEAMEGMRRNMASKDLSIESNQDDFTSRMERLDKEEQAFSLEIKGLSEQRAQLNKRLIDGHASLFVSRKTILITTIISLVALSSGLVLSQRHVLFNDLSPKQRIKN